MIRKFTLLFLACVGVFSLSMAQKCGFDEMHRLKMATDPEYAATVNQFNTSMVAWMQSQQNMSSLVTTYNGNKSWEIPVVVHIIDTGLTAQGSKYNPTDAQVINMINYLSQAFTASYSGHLTEPNGGTRIPIVFKLAARTPNCAATSGIIRVNAGSDATYVAGGVRGLGISDNALKAKSYWPNTEYYNVWIVNKIEGKNTWNVGPGVGYTLGYALFPPGGPSLIDGTVMLSDQLNVGNSTITHELGHAFNLYHVFEDDDPDNDNIYTCPVAPGDFCADTQPMIRSPFNCPAEGTNTCNPPSNLYLNTQRNFMDYSNCKDRFTPDQRLRVYGALMNVNSVRSSLISSLGATPIGSSTVTAALCNPSGGSTSPSDRGPRTVTLWSTVGADTMIMNAVSGNLSTDFATIPTNHLFDRTCQHRVELVAGQKYKIRVGVGNNFQEYVRVWIDYNNSGVFSPLEEVYAPANQYLNINNGLTDNGRVEFTVPLTATACTPLRMRVVSNSGTVPGACQPGINGEAEDYEVIIRGGQGSGVIVPNKVNLTLADGIGNPSCDSTYIKLIAKPAAGVVPMWYQWFKKTAGSPSVLVAGPSVAPVNDTSLWESDGTYPTWFFGDKDTIIVKMALPGTCGADTSLDSFVIYRPDFVAPSVGIGPVSGIIPTCVDEIVTLGITSQSNTGGATFQWVRNNVAIPGANSATYNVVNQGNGDQYRLDLTLTPVNCNNFKSSISSNTVPVTHTTKKPTAKADLTTGTNPGCAGQVLTYTASGTILGTSPSYAWYVNGILIPSATASTFSSTFNNGDVVSVVITSSSLCRTQDTAMFFAPAIQHQLKNADITIAQVSGGNPACSGHAVVFSATPVNSGPPAPQFQWLINNAPVIGANSPIFNTTALLNGDVVKCVLISTDPCVVNTLDTSAPIQMNVKPSKVPKISFTLTKGNNPGCLDSLVEFTATVTDAGANPQIEWLVNGFPLNLNNPVYSTTNLLNNDVVIARVVPTDGECYLPDTGFSVPVTMVRSPTPNPPIISLINNMLVTNINGSFVWFGPGGQLTGGEDGRYHPGELGQYYAVTNNNGCWSKPSNILTITLLDINDVNMQPANIYPNPTTGKLTVDWGRNVNMTVGIYSTVGQKLMEERASNVSHKVVDLASLASGMYFVVVTDENGRSSTTRITLQR